MFFYLFPRQTKSIFFIFSSCFVINCPAIPDSFLIIHRNTQVLFELSHIRIHNQRLREFRFTHQLQSPVIYGDIKRDMRITSQDDGDFILFTQPQNLQIIGSCRRFVTDRIQGTVIDFQQCMMFFCSQDYRFEIQFGRPVTGMTDDVDVWIGNGLHHCR